ncbi:uncharacterized protein LOC135501462 [Lineus longissimus]|uniref:uncharacterized protein LOC135501462 n=1 Tax=Lineus longissimus TaxID=88925 RepID=UPI002B4CB017
MPMLNYTQFTLNLTTTAVTANPTVSTHAGSHPGSSLSNEKLVITATAVVFCFPVLIISIICLLRLRVHLLDKRDKQSMRRRNIDLNEDVRNVDYSAIRDDMQLEG